MDKVQRWIETKREIYVLARGASEVISEAAASIFAECSQYVKTGFYLESGEAEAYVYGGGFEVAGHAPKAILISHWSGSLEDWKVVEEELRLFLDKQFVREKLIERL